MNFRISAVGSTRRSERPNWSLIAPVLCVAALIVAAPRQASAQALEEVVVTAQKRAQNLQDVGVSVSAISGDELQTLGVQSTQDLSHVVPGLQFNSASGGDYGAQLTIRGIATTDFSPNQESPNSLYMDDVYFSAPNAQTGIMFDVDRIEVLRGPQGTLFGRNSTGGLVNIITKKPTTDFEGYADITGGEFNEVKFQGAVSGPLTSWLQGRLAVVSQNNQGYDENRLAGYPDLNSINFRGVRGQLQFEFSNQVTGLLTLYFTHDNNREGFYGHVNTYYDPSDGGRPAPLPADLNAWGTGPGLDQLGYRSPYGISLTSEINHIGYLRRDLTMPSFRLDWELPGGATLTALTNFTNLQFAYDESCAAAPQLTCEDPYSQHLTQWSQELRVGKTTDRLSWVTGLYALYISQRDTGGFLEPYYSGTPFAFNSYDNIYQKTTTGAAFGQIEYLLTPHWRPTFGVRVGHDEKNFSSQTYYRELGDLVSADTVYDPPLLVNDFSPATVGGAATERETDWSGKVQMDYLWSKETLTYAGISRGVKGAGFNADSSGGISNANVPFKPEHVVEYEIGEKVTALDGHLRVNGAAFYYDYHGFQAYQPVNAVAPFTTNSNARFEGAELEITARPLQGLEIQAGVTGLGTRVYNVHTAEIGVVDQQSADAPKWQSNALIRYTRPLGSAAVTVIWSSDYIGSRYHSIDNTPAVFVHSSIGHNASVAYAIDHWVVTAGVTNLFNAVRQTTAYDLTSIGGYSDQTYMPPRWWTLSVRYQLGE
jgi:iron complex outermembrane recepter protein